MTVYYKLFDSTGLYDPATAPGSTESRAGIVGPVSGVTYNNRTKLTKRMTDGSNTSNPTQYQSDSGGPTSFAPVRHAYFADSTSPSGYGLRIRSLTSNGESGNRYQFQLGLSNLSVPSSGVIERWTTQVIRYNNFKLTEIGPSDAKHFALFGGSHRFTNGLNGPYMNQDMGVPIGHHYININLSGTVISSQTSAPGYKDLGAVTQGTIRKFEWRIGYSRTSAGYLEVWVDGVKVHSYSGTTVYSGGADIEFRTGSYYGSAFTTSPDMEILWHTIASTQAEAAPPGSTGGGGGGGGGTPDPPPPPVTTVPIRNVSDTLDSATTTIFTTSTGTTAFTAGSMQLTATQADKIAQRTTEAKYVASGDAIMFNGIAWPDKTSGTGTLEARFVADFADGDRFIFRRQKVWGTSLTAVTGATSTDLFTKTAHGLVAGDTVQFTGFTGGSNVVPGQMYYVIATGLTTNVFAVSATSGGSALDLGSDVSGATVTKFRDFYSMYLREAEVIGGMTNFDAPTVIPGVNAVKFVYNIDKRTINVHLSSDMGVTYTQDLGGIAFVADTTDKPQFLSAVAQIVDGDNVPTTFAIDTVAGTTATGIGGGTGAGAVSAEGMTFSNARTARLQFPPGRLTLPFCWLWLARRGSGTGATNLGGVTKDGTNAGRWLTWYHPSDTSSGFAGQLRLSDAVGGAAQAFGAAGPTSASKWFLIMAGMTTAKQAVFRWADIDPVPIDSANRFHHTENAGTFGTGGAITSTAAKFMIADADFVANATNYEGDQRMFAEIAGEPLTAAAFEALVTSNFIVLRSKIAALPNLAAFKEFNDANAGSSSTGTQVTDRVSSSLNEDFASRAGTTTAYTGTDVPYDTAGTGGSTPPPTPSPQVPTPTSAPTASSPATAGGVGSFTLTGVLPTADATISFTPHASAPIRFFYSDDGITLTAIGAYQASASVSVTSVPLDVERRYYYRWRNNDATPKEGDYSPALLYTVESGSTLVPLTAPTLTRAPIRLVGGLLNVYVAIPAANQSVDSYHVYLTPRNALGVATGAEFLAYDGAGTTTGGEVLLPVTGLSDAVPRYGGRVAAWRTEP